MKEIGGYFELDKREGSLYHDNAVALNSGRHCLEYLILSRGISKLYIPEFICDTIEMTCQKSGCLFEYYQISREFIPLFQKTLAKHEYIYIVNFYGQITAQAVKEFHEKYGNIIIDNVQAYFQKPEKGIDTLYSCRKFLGVSDGGFLYTDCPPPYTLLNDLSYERILFVIGRYEENAEKFYKKSKYNNSRFEKEPIKNMSKLTKHILKGIDYERVKRKREENFKYLHDKLDNSNTLKLIFPPGPFMYPYYCDKAEQVREILIKKKIYVPILWIDTLNRSAKNSVAFEYASKIIPLPCDQRYGEEEMQYIADTVLQEGGNIIHC